MNKYRCKCGSFANPNKPCQKCGFMPPRKIICTEHDWLDQLDPETGIPAKICQNCGMRRPL